MTRKLLLISSLCATALLTCALIQGKARNHSLLSFLSGNAATKEASLLSNNVPAIIAKDTGDTLVPKGDNRLTGVWTNAQKDYVIVFLSDGRTASFNHKFENYTESDSHVTIELGAYRVDNNKVSYQWLITGPQSEYFEGTGNELLFYTNPKSPYKVSIYRVAGAEQAPAYYNELYQKRMASAQDFGSQIPTGQAKTGPLQIQAYYDHDPNPKDIFSGAKVYTVFAKYSWVEGDHTYTPISPEDPGVTFQSFILMPNGRFIYDAWLHGFQAFDNFRNAEPRNEQERRDRTVTAKHYQMFGKYRIIAQGDMLQGDTIELLYTDGSRKIVKVVSGREYMRVPGSGFNYINMDYSRLEQARRTQRK